jgi:hypothetical protein
MSYTDTIPRELFNEFTDAVEWLQGHGRSELTIAAAVTEALEDWVAGVRAEHLRDLSVPAHMTPVIRETRR